MKLANRGRVKRLIKKLHLRVALRTHPLVTLPHHLRNLIAFDVCIASSPYFNSCKIDAIIVIITIISRQWRLTWTALSNEIVDRTKRCRDADLDIDVVFWCQEKNPETTFQDTKNPLDYIAR